LIFNACSPWTFLRVARKSENSEEGLFKDERSKVIRKSAISPDNVCNSPIIAMSSFCPCSARYLLDSGRFAIVCRIFPSNKASRSTIAFAEIPNFWHKVNMMSTSSLPPTSIMDTPSAPKGISRLYSIRFNNCWSM